MADWPATLPQDLLQGASIMDDESRAIQSMDQGPPSYRNRFTAITKTLKARIVLTGSQLAIFNEFFRTTIDHGASSFNWIDPTDDTNASMRFRKKPEWVCLRPDPAPDLRLWQGDLELEIQP